MKKVLFLISLIFMTMSYNLWSQSSRDAHYKKLNELIENGLIEDAQKYMSKNSSFFDHSKEESELILSGLFKQYLKFYGGDDDTEKLAAFVKTINQSKSDYEKSLRYFLAAKSFEGYFNAHSWDIRQRTTLTQSDDIKMWGEKNFNDTILSLYKKSLSYSDVLQNTPIEKLSLLITDHKSYSDVYTNVYDFISREFLDFTKNDFYGSRMFLSDASWVNQSYFEPKTVVISKDIEPVHQFAAEVFQKALDFYEKKGNTRSQMYWDLDKLSYYSDLKNNPSLTRPYLLKYVEVYQSIPDHVYPFVVYLKSFMSEDVKSKDFLISVPKSSQILKTNRDIADYLQTVVKEYPHSNVSQLSIQLLYQLLDKTASLTIPSVVLPQQNTPILISYKNITSVKIDVYKTDYFKFYSTPEIQKAQITAKNLVKSDTYQWAAHDDLGTHSVEVPFYGLPLGQYMVVLSYLDINGQYQSANDYTLVQVSDIALVKYVNSKSENIYSTVDRLTGELKTVDVVDVYDVYVDYISNAYKYTFKSFKKMSPQSSDFIQNDFVAPHKNYRQKLMVFKKGTSVFYHDEYIYDRGSRTNAYNSESAQKSDLIYTDRAAYRPGQKVQVKVIHYASEAKEKNNFKTVANAMVDVELYDANGQTVDSVRVTTNDFGSAEVTFSLPQNLLNGQFTIRTSNGAQKFIRVEEYKRPTYKVAFDTLTESYKINDNITIKGHAEAYAGYGIADARVKYTIKRTVRYPYLWRCYWMPINTKSTVIATGEVKTNNQGEFSIPVELLADADVDQSVAPVFNYEVEATVVDLNGETKIETTYITAGFESDFVSISVKDVVENSQDTLRIDVHNINMKPLERHVDVKVYQLKSEEFKRKRLWAMPDQKLLTEQEFTTLFPFDEYGHESNVFEREKVKTVFEKSNVSSQQANWSMDDLNLSDNGYYLVEATITSASGRQVVDKKFFHVYKKSLLSASQKELILLPNKTTIQPEETLSIDVVTPLKDRFIMSQLASFTGVKVFNGQKKVTYKVVEKDRGGIWYNVAYMSNNRMYTNTLMIDVPFTNKELQVKWKSHRDKVVPGDEESWSFEVIGAPADQIEMLATLYDASLDEIESNEFSAHAGLYRRYYFNSNYTQIGFDIPSISAQITNTVKAKSDYIQIVPQLGYQELLGFRGRYYSNNIQLRGAPIMLMESAPTSMMSKANSNVVYDEISAASTENESGVKVEDKDNRSASEISVRKNLSETAFFIPMKRNENGEFKFDFTFPESNTSWKMLALAHTQDMKFGTLTGEVKSQKDVMIQPNAPRFVRQGDVVELSAKVMNLSNEALQVKAFVEIFNPNNNQIINASWLSSSQSLPLLVQAQASQSAVWTVNVPDDYTGLIGVRYFADAQKFQDAVEYVFPVLTDKQVVTEAYPMFINGSGQAKVDIQTKSKTLQPMKLVVEYSASPMWYVIQSVPQFLEVDNPTTDGLAQQLLMTVLALKIAQDNPDIITKLKNNASTQEKTLESRLDQNQDLKNILLQETPWVLESQSMTQQLNNLLATFDLATLQSRQNRLTRELFKKQHSDGGWPWMDNMVSNQYTTNSVLRTLAKMEDWGIPTIKAEPFSGGIQQAVKFVDGKYLEEMKLYWKNSKGQPYISSTFIDYMAMRLQIQKMVPVPQHVMTEMNSYYEHVSSHMIKQHHYQKAQWAIISFEMNKKEEGQKLIESIRQSAVVKDEMGMYWPLSSSGYYWYHNSFEAHYWVLKAFKMYGVKDDYISALKKWILKQKQTQHWGSTRNTMYALDALVLSDKEWVTSDAQLSVQYNGNEIDVKAMQSYKDWGYIRQTVDSGKNIPSKKFVQVDVQQKSTTMPTWGGVYWQYQEDIENIQTNPNTPFKIKKKYYIKDNNSLKESWKEVNAQVGLKVGDVVKVILLLEIDRDVEFVHIKDYRPSAFEPVDNKSGYTYGTGIGYYMNIKDASVDFFMDRVNKGHYTMEYEMKVEGRGVYQSGTAEIQSYYAPEFRNIAPSVEFNIK